MRILAVLVTDKAHRNLEGPGWQWTHAGLSRWLLLSIVGGVKNSCISGIPKWYFYTYLFTGRSLVLILPVERVLHSTGSPPVTVAGGDGGDVRGAEYDHVGRRGQLPTKLECVLAGALVQGFE
jgi:hypothetical protein